MEIKHYNKLYQNQTEKIHELYNKSFELLKIPKEKFVNRLININNKHFFLLAEKNNKIQGFLIAINNSIALIITDEKYRNRGIGSSLLTEAEKLIKKNYSELDLGSAELCLCGVPMDTKSDYHSWFINRGYEHDWNPIDMLMDLDAFEYSEKNHPCTLVGTIFKKLESEEEKKSCYKGADSVIKGWGEFYKGENTDAIIAVKDNIVLGGILVSSSLLFSESFKNTGSINALWTLEKYRKHGIGMNLYQRSLNEVKKRGLKYCHLYYTYRPLDQYYGKTGAKICLEYWRGTKKF